MKTFDLKTWVRPNILKLSPYSSARDEFTDFNADLIFLDANENPFENEVNRYPDPQQRSLKSLLAERKKVEESQLLIGNGSDEVLDLIIRAFAEPAEDEVIIMPPTYGMYKVLSDINNVKCKEVYLTNSFELDADEILRNVSSKTKIIFICSPNNPTANSFDDKAIQKLLANFAGVIVIDEAYIDFANQDSWIAMLDLYPNLIVTQTLSKAYGLAGIRLGTCYASSEIIAVLNTIKPPYNVNSLSQKRAISRIESIDEVKNEVKKIIEERNQLAIELTSLSFVEKVFPSETNFLLVKVDNADIRYNQLITCGIVVRNRSGQPLCKDMLRFTIGTIQENEQLLSALKELK